jgi:hypothetical protein
MFSVLYFCLLLPLLLAVVQGAESLAGWRLNFSVPRYGKDPVFIPGNNVADPGCLSRILIFTHPGSRIQGLGSKNGNKREG